jgi:hypothetical protein
VHLINEDVIGAWHVAITPEYYRELKHEIVDYVYDDERIIDITTDQLFKELIVIDQEKEKKAPSQKRSFLSGLIDRAKSIAISSFLFLVLANPLIASTPQVTLTQQDVAYYNKYIYDYQEGIDRDFGIIDKIPKINLDSNDNDGFLQQIDFYNNIEVSQIEIFNTYDYDYQIDIPTQQQGKVQASILTDFYGPETEIHEQPNAQEIKESLEKLAENSKQGKTTIISLFGHGINKDGIYVLAASDKGVAEEDLPKTVVTEDELDKLIPNFKGSVVLMIQSCHAAACDLDEKYPGKVHIIASSRSDEPGRNIQEARDMYRGLSKGSIFVHFFNNAEEYILQPKELKINERLLVAKLMTERFTEELAKLGKVASDRGTETGLPDHQQSPKITLKQPGD